MDPYKRNKVLRRIFGSKKNEITKEWRKLHNEELNDLYSSPNIARIIKSRRMRWLGHVARMGKGEAWTGFWWGNLRVSDHLGDPDIDGTIILRWIFRQWDVGLWTESSWFRIGTGGGNLWMRERTFGFHKMRETSWLAENRLASQEGLCSVELVSLFVRVFQCKLGYVQLDRVSRNKLYSLPTYCTYEHNNMLLSFSSTISCMFQLSIAIFKESF